MCGVRGTASGRRHTTNQSDAWHRKTQCWEGGGGAALLPQIPRPSALLITRQPLSHPIDEFQSTGRDELLLLLRLLLLLLLLLQLAFHFQHVDDERRSASGTLL